MPSLLLEESEMSTEYPEDFPFLVYSNLGVRLETWHQILEFDHISKVRVYLAGPPPAYLTDEEQLYWFKRRLEDYIQTWSAQAIQNSPQVNLGNTQPKKKLQPRRGAVRSWKPLWSALSTLDIPVKYVWKAISLVFSAGKFLLALAFLAYHLWGMMPALPRLEWPKPVPPAPTPSFPACCEGYRGTPRIPMPELARKTQRLTGIAGEVAGLRRQVHKLVLTTRVLQYSDRVLSKNHATLGKQVVALQNAIDSASRNYHNVSLVGGINTSLPAPQWTSTQYDQQEGMLELTGRMDKMEIRVDLLCDRTKKTLTEMKQQVAVLANKPAYGKDPDQSEFNTKILLKLTDVQSHLVKETAARKNDTSQRFSDISGEVDSRICKMLNMLSTPLGLIANRFTLLEAEVFDLAMQYREFTLKAMADAVTLQEHINGMNAHVRGRNQPAIQNLVLRLTQRPTNVESFWSIRGLLKSIIDFDSLNPFTIAVSYPQLVVEVVYWTPLASVLPEQWQMSLLVSVGCYIIGRRRRHAA